MEQREIEERLRKELADDTPEIFDSIMQELSADLTMEENSADERFADGRFADASPAEKRSGPKWVKWIGAAAAAVAVIVVSSKLFARPAAPVRVAVVELDVNPSVELEVDGSDRVIACKAINEEGSEILEGLDLEGADVNEAANDLTDSMIAHGYLNGSTNSILVSVVSDDAEAGKRLEETLAGTLNDHLSGSDLSAAVLGQYLASDEETAAFAAAHSISLGKARLIRMLAASGGKADEDALLGLSTQELLLLWMGKAENGLAEQADTAYGSVSAEQYISPEAAKDAALQKLGLSASDVSEVFSEFECDNGVLVYEIEFEYNSAEYEIDVDASTGTVLEYETDDEDEEEYDDEDDDRDDEEINDDDGYDHDEDDEPDDENDDRDEDDDESDDEAEDDDDESDDDDD